MRFRNTLCLLAILAAPVCAQQARLDERLPSTTSFYVYWRGSGSMGAVRSTNALLRLWDDPESAPARNALMEWVERKRVEMKVPASVTRETIYSLLENPFVFGSLTPIETTSDKVKTSAAQPKPARQDNFFLVYDTTGKQALVESLLKLESSDPQDAEKVTRLKFRQFDVEEVKGTKSTHYRALAGNFFLIADRKESIEAMLMRYAAEGATARAMGGAADFQEARRAMGEQTSLEVVFNFADLMQSALAQQKGPQADAVDAVGLTRLRMFVCGIAFESDATRVHAALLGDMRPGSIFDLLGKSEAAFSTVNMVPADTANFSAMWIDFPAIYGLGLKFVGGMMPPGQDAAAGLDAAATQMFGMTAKDVLQLFTGEFAAFSSSVGLDPLGNVFAIGIRKPADVQRVLRSALSSEIQSEDFQGGMTIFSITTPFTDSKSGAARRKFLYVGLTPNMILVAPRKALLRELAANGNRPGNAAPMGLAGNAQFNAARARLPWSLTGLGYVDFSRVNWDELAKEIAPASNAAAAGSRADLKGLLEAELISKYLHFAISGWWKSTSGIHFNGFIE